MDRTTLTRALAPLVRDGLVKMVTGDDRRTRIISLTPHGQSTLDAARPIWRSAQEQVARDTGPDRIEHLLGELATLVEQVRQTSEGPSR
jgi:DNA-binding MarR family transcriptional regulator